MADELRNGHVLETVVFGLVEGQAILNVFHHRLISQPAVPPDVTIDEIAVAIRDKFRTGVIVNLNIAYQALQYQVTAYDGREGGQIEPPTPFKVKLGQRGVAPGGLVADTGTTLGDYEPTFVGVGLIKRTKQAGREGRGAIRLAGISESNIAGNVVNPALSALLKAGLEVLFVNPIAVAMSATTKVKGVVFNKTRFLSKDNGVNIPDGFVQDITSISERPFASSQTTRKRLAVLGA